MAKRDFVMNWPAQILLIGCGNMSGAILARWLHLGLPPERVTVIRPSGAAVAEGVSVQTQLAGPVSPGTLVMLGMKPQQLATVAEDTAQFIGEGVTLVSILAGVPIQRLREAFPGAGNILRCMPNLPVRIGKGVCILKSENDGEGQGDRALASELFGGLGLVEWLEDEQLFDAATALAGCGPAFVYRFIDSLAVAGAELGLDPASAARMALMTVEGAAISASNGNQSPQTMADAVASKGGMTREGLDVLDRPVGILSLMNETLRAARDRGAVLAALSNKAG